MEDHPDWPDRLRMPLVEAMETQRAVRRLRTDPVGDDVVLELCRLAQKAPSGGNRQMVEFVIVRDAAVKHQLARLNRQAWALYRRVAAREARGDLKTARMLAAVQWQADHFEDTPVLVVVCQKGRPWPGHLGRVSWYGSVFPAVQNLLLAARAVGLGATLTTLPLWSRALARRTLTLPRDVTPCAVVPLGWPLRAGYGPTTRRPLREVVHLDAYGRHPAPDTDPGSGTPTGPDVGDDPTSR